MEQKKVDQKTAQLRRRAKTRKWFEENLPEVEKVILA